MCKTHKKNFQRHAKFHFSSHESNFTIAPYRFLVRQQKFWIKNQINFPKQSVCAIEWNLKGKKNFFFWRSSTSRLRRYVFDFSIAIWLSYFFHLLVTLNADFFSQTKFESPMPTKVNSLDLKMNTKFVEKFCEFSFVYFSHFSHFILFSFLWWSLFGLRWKDTNTYRVMSNGKEEKKNVFHHIRTALCSVDSTWSWFDFVIETIGIYSSDSIMIWVM